ncbi:hypothetical protein SPHINGO8BC_60237 [Sphingobacterium multivorum]|uniref:Uncharacterized protein n=1 Tax=Sphingobacterium multivorum TaxID=28454 RepID=A0A654DPX5_SPHMU|nr:hypothetical protein SPHINGO8BC_60237 [Sphingobacterium multivorum]
MGLGAVSFLQDDAAPSIRISAAATAIFVLMYFMCCKFLTKVMIVNY